MNIPTPPPKPNLDISIDINNQPALDRYGYLADINDWNLALAEHYAKELNISLSPIHVEIINFARHHYLTYEIAPSMRLIVQHLKGIGPSHSLDTPINSVLIATLFPGNTAQHISKIAGLPKPTRCT